MRKKLLTLAASLAILAGGVFAYFAIAAPAQATSYGSSCGPRDYDNNAIIRGGGCSTDALKGKVKGDVDNVFRHYSVPTNLAGAKKGEVHRNGNVVVDGKVVASGAQTVGRHKFGNSKAVHIDGKKYWQGSPGTRWSSGTKSLKAFVFFNKHGEFVSAVLVACGNPVEGKPKVKVAYKCDTLTSSKIDRTRYDLKVDTSQYRASFKSVTFNVYNKNGTKVDSKTTNSKTYRYTQTTPGEYTIKATVTFNVNGSAKAASVGNCVTKITVDSEPCPYNPELPKGHPDCYEPCPHNPELPKDSPKCYEPCPHNPELPKDSPKCYEPCPYNPDLPKDSPDCEEPKKPVYDCNALTASLIGDVTDRTYKYAVDYTAENGATLQTADFNFGDGETQAGVTPSQLNSVQHTYAKEGDYTTAVTLHFNIGDTTKTATCSVKVTASPDKEEPCPYNPELPKGHPDCYEPCPHNPDLPKDSEDCQPPCDCEEPEEPPVTPEEPQTPEEPKGKGEEAPAEIPKTGAGSVIGAFAGLGSIGAASYYYVASRRELLGKLMNR